MASGGDEVEGRGSAEGRKTVCVTGASGYIASWLVKLLLARSYTVRASVRSIADRKKIEHLRCLDGASERLQLFEADLLKEGSFDAVVEGSECVFHTASPCYFNPVDPKTELIDPAVNGTLNILRSCSRASTVKRVVITSSTAAVAFTDKPKTPDVVVDETWFSSPQVCEERKLFYCLAKTLAEEAAWEFAKKNGVDLITINPGYCIGPLLQPTLNASSANILNLINGSPTYGNAFFGWVNVKDVAMAHILAFEVPSASGRYLMVERCVHYSDIVKIIHDLYPSIALPDKCADTPLFLQAYQISSERAKGLGVEFIPLEDSIKETIESLKEKGFVTTI